jgi:hypothetical protein
MTLSYTETMRMPGVMFDALLHALQIKRRIQQDEQQESDPEPEPEKPKKSHGGRRTGIHHKGA